MNYYYSIDGSEVAGPCSFDDLKTNLFTGALPATTQVCIEGTETWQALNSLVKPPAKSADRPPPIPTMNAEDSGRLVIQLPPKHPQVEVRYNGRFVAQVDRDSALTLQVPKDAIHRIKIGLTSADVSVPGNAYRVLNLRARLFRRALEVSDPQTLSDDTPKPQKDLTVPDWKPTKMPSAKLRRIIIIYSCLGFLFGIFGLHAFTSAIYLLGRIKKGEMEAGGEASLKVAMVLGIVGFIINFSLIILASQ